MFTSIKSTILRIFDKFKSKKINRILRLLLQDQLLTLVDIGAADVIQPRWLNICGLINYIGFEPDKRSYDELLNTKNACHSYKIFNYALWSESTDLKINLLKKPLVSSHFEPNTKIIENFPNKERFDLVSVKRFSAVKLDDLKIENPDFIKIDVQGGELEIIKGANYSLNNCIGLEVEVEFTHIYKNQPLFGNICEYLNNCGFIFIDFTSLVRWERNKLDGYGQLIFGDALFLKPPEYHLDTSNVNLEFLKKYISICFLYKRFDLILSTLEYCKDIQIYKEYINQIEKIIIKNSNTDLRIRAIYKILVSPFRFFSKYFQSYLMY
tara:strand:+ start:140 stop:1111 length:972 start_codon:yes stop_codon:yes gene_type:complete